MQFSPFLKQAIGASVGVMMAGGIYIGIRELSLTHGSVLEPVSAQTVTGIKNEQHDRIARIAGRTRRALTQAPRRLPPAAYESLHEGAQLPPATGAPRKIEQPAPRTAPQGTPRNELSQYSADLPGSGPPLALVGMFAFGAAGARISLRRKNPVSYGA